MASSIAGQGTSSLNDCDDLENCNVVCDDGWIPWAYLGQQCWCSSQDQPLYDARLCCLLCWWIVFCSTPTGSSVLFSYGWVSDAETCASSRRMESRVSDGVLVGDVFVRSKNARMSIKVAVGFYVFDHSVVLQSIYVFLFRSPPTTNMLLAHTAPCVESRHNYPPQ